MFLKNFHADDKEEDKENEPKAPMPIADFKFRGEPLLQENGQLHTSVISKLIRAICFSVQDLFRYADHLSVEGDKNSRKIVFKDNRNAEGHAAWTRAIHEFIRCHCID